MKFGVGVVPLQHSFKCHTTENTNMADGRTCEVGSIRQPLSTVTDLRKIEAWWLNETMKKCELREDLNQWPPAHDSNSHDRANSQWVGFTVAYLRIVGINNMPPAELKVKMPKHDKRSLLIPVSCVLKWRAGSEAQRNEPILPLVKFITNVNLKTRVRQFNYSCARNANVRSLASGTGQSARSVTGHASIVRRQPRQTTWGIGSTLSHLSDQPRSGTGDLKPVSDTSILIDINPSQLLLC